MSVLLAGPQSDGTAPINGGTAPAPAGCSWGCARLLPRPSPRVRFRIGRGGPLVPVRRHPRGLDPRPLASLHRVEPPGELAPVLSPSEQLPEREPPSPESLLHPRRLLHLVRPPPPGVVPHPVDREMHPKPLPLLARRPRPADQPRHPVAHLRRHVVHPEERAPRPLRSPPAHRPVHPESRILPEELAGHPAVEGLLVRHQLPGPPFLEPSQTRPHDRPALVGTAPLSRLEDLAAPPALLRSARPRAHLPYGGVDEEARSARHQEPHGEGP